VPPLVENTDPHATALAPLLDETDERIEIVFALGGPGEEAQKDVGGVETIFCLLPLGDLTVTSPASQAAAFCVKDGLTCMGNPSDCAVRPDNSKLRFSGSLLRLELPQVIREQMPIIGMDDFLDKMGILKKSPWGITGDPLAGRRDVEKLPLRAHPPFPIVGIVGNDPVLDLRFTEGHVTPSAPDFRSLGFRSTCGPPPDPCLPTVFRLLLIFHGSLPYEGV
jgi:hypothetical protein